MPSLENDLWRLDISPDAMNVTVVDRTRKLTWRLSSGSRMYRPAGTETDLPLPPGRARRDGGAVVMHFDLPEGSLEFTWTLGKDFVEVTLTGQAHLEGAALPGAFQPIGAGAWEIAVPIYQGCLIRPSGRPWQAHTRHGGHASFSMAMAATLTDGGSLLMTHESPRNWQADYGEGGEGLYVAFRQQHCPVEAWRGAAVRFYGCGAGLTAACRRYRRVLQQRGDWRSWDEKIAAKPILRNLFGALMCFLGYNRTDEIDYVDSARRLKAEGFERIFFYPVRMCHYSLDFLMGGDKPTWHDDETIEALGALGGVFLAPWTWVFEGLDDGSKAMAEIFRIRDGKPVANWKMDENRWYQVCPPYQIEHLKKRLATDMKRMDWLHFDVSACVPGATCTSRDHAAHGNRPMGGLADMHFTRRLMSVETVGNRVASSEGFSDFFCRDYDIGSTKMLPLQTGEPRAMAVPMTMLCLHDCCVHDWWEVHNYNARPEWPVGPTAGGLGLAGAGLPHLKAAMDALTGCPPNVFAFGKQYAWVDKPGGATKPYIVRLDDAPVREAVEAARPVAALHGRIGMCDLESLEFLSDDRYVQASRFSDGTRIVANLAPAERAVEGLGALAAHTWREITD